jgi:hypothetical protein
VFSVNASTSFAFDPRRFFLLDPSARSVSSARGNRGAAIGPGDNVATRALGRPLAVTIVYELHVAGFTRSPTSGVTQAGISRGLGDAEQLERFAHLAEALDRLAPSPKPVRTGRDARAPSRHASSIILC